jgi:uncharacterized repeat protein (TIGR01451 family)
MDKGIRRTILYVIALMGVFLLPILAVAQVDVSSGVTELENLPSDVSSGWVRVTVSDSLDTFEQNTYVSYRLTVSNISNQVIRNATVIATIPEELIFIETDMGSYNPEAHIVAFQDSSFSVEERHSFYIHTHAKTAYENLQATPVVASVQISYLNPISGASESATAYDVNYGYAPITYPGVEVVQPTLGESMVALVQSSDVEMNVIIVVLAVVLVILEVVLLAREYPQYMPAWLRPRTLAEKYSAVAVDEHVHAKPIPSDEIRDVINIENSHQELVYQGHLGK